jgi:hypothetical protein
VDPDHREDTRLVEEEHRTRGRHSPEEEEAVAIVPPAAVRSLAGLLRGTPGEVAGRSFGSIVQAAAAHCILPGRPGKRLTRSCKTLLLRWLTSMTAAWASCSSAAQVS